MIKVKISPDLMSMDVLNKDGEKICKWKVKEENGKNQCTGGTSGNNFITTQIHYNGESH